MAKYNGPSGATWERLLAIDDASQRAGIPSLLAYRHSTRHATPHTTFCHICLLHTSIFCTHLSSAHIYLLQPCVGVSGSTASISRSNMVQRTNVTTLGLPRPIVWRPTIAMVLRHRATCVADNTESHMALLLHDSSSEIGHRITRGPTLSTDLVKQQACLPPLLLHATPRTDATPCHRLRYSP